MLLNKRQLGSREKKQKEDTKDEAKWPREGLEDWLEDGKKIKRKRRKKSISRVLIADRSPSPVDLTGSGKPEMTTSLPNLQHAFLPAGSAQ